MSPRKEVSNRTRNIKLLNFNSWKSIDRYNVYISGAVAIVGFVAFTHTKYAGSLSHSAHEFNVVGATAGNRSPLNEVWPTDHHFNSKRFRMLLIVQKYVLFEPLGVGFELNLTWKIEKKIKNYTEYGIASAKIGNMWRRPMREWYEAEAEEKIDRWSIKYIYVCCAVLWLWQTVYR